MSRVGGQVRVYVEWTKAFLNQENGLIFQVLQGLSQDDVTTGFGCMAQWYTVDALLVSGNTFIEEPARLDHSSFPSRLDVLVEHENGERWEEEMWKLIFWRSPLKVLIGYDLPDERRTTAKRQEWLGVKTQMLRSMLDRANAAFGEMDSEYLLIVGSQRKGEVYWRWTRLDRAPSGPPEFIEMEFRLP